MPWAPTREQRVTVEQALHVDHRQHQVGFQAGVARFPVDQAQKTQAFLLIGNIAPQPGGHVQQPDLGIEGIGKTIGL